MKSLMSKMIPPLPQKNHYYNFHVPLGPFQYAKFQKNPWTGPKVMRIHHFWVQN